jgi:hypothetical protein
MTMLFERRAYTLRPGSEPNLLGVATPMEQTRPPFRPLLERNLGYFAMAAGDGERIVHLYRWDNYDDAKQRLGAIVTPERMEYFHLRQEASSCARKTPISIHAPVARA